MMVVVGVFPAQSVFEELDLRNRGQQRRQDDAENQKALQGVDATRFSGRGSISVYCRSGDVSTSSEQL